MIKLEITRKEKVWLIGLIKYELDNANEEVKNNSNRYLVFKGILDKLYKIEEQQQENITINKIKSEILTLAINIVNEEFRNTKDYNKGLSLYECENTLSILQDKYKLNKEV